MNAYFFGLAFLAAANPKLLGVDLLLIDNRRARAMFLALLVGAMAMTLTVGIVDVLVVQADTIDTQGSASATLELVLGAALLLFGVLLGTGRIHRRQNDRAARGRSGRDEGEGRMARALREPRLGLAFLVGLVVGTPGASYIAALHHLVTGHYSTANQIVGVILFCLIEYVLIIVPFLFLCFQPEATELKLRAFSSWLASHARQLIAWVTIVVGVYMVIDGLVRVV
jgi:ABC-type Na+ efflux pump permease subunit